MPSQGTRSSGTSAGRLITSLAMVLCTALPAFDASAQPRESIPPALFGGSPDEGQRAKQPVKPAGTPTYTPFGTIYRPLESDSFVPFSEPETAPLHPKQLPRQPDPAPAAVPPQPPAPEPAPVPAASPPPAEPPVEAPAAPVPANVPLPPRAPANRGGASTPPAPDAPASPAQGGNAPQAPAAVPPPASLPPVSTLSDRQIVERASRFFNTMDTMQASFTQLGGSQRTTGMFYLERPGRLRFAYNPPSTLEIVSDGKNVAIRDSKLKTSDVYAINQTPLKFLLRDPINLGTDLKVLHVERDPTSIQITLEDSSTIGGKAQITLFFDQQVQNLTRWTIVDAQGYTTTVILSQVKRTKRNG